MANYVLCKYLQFFPKATEKKTSKEIFVRFSFSSSWCLNHNLTPKKSTNYLLNYDANQQQEVVVNTKKNPKNISKNNKVLNKITASLSLQKNEEKTRKTMLDKQFQTFSSTFKSKSKSKAKVKLKNQHCKRLSTQLDATAGYRMQLRTTTTAKKGIFQY